MRLRPPKRYLRSGAKDFKRYMGRVVDAHAGALFMTIWEYWGDRRGFSRQLYSNVDLQDSGVTKSGVFSLGTPVEIWTWNEGLRERLHVRSCD